MKVIIAGPRDCYDYELVVKAIEESKFEITEVVSGKAKGVDSLGERWAKRNNIPVADFPAKWNDLEAEGALVREGQYGKYNAKAGFVRNGQMAEYADALIAVDHGTGGTADMIKQAREQGIEVFIYSGETGYVF